MDIAIGMKRSRIERLMADLTAELAKDGEVQVEVTGIVNGSLEPCTVRIDSYDMDRDDVKDDDVYVDVDR